MKKSGWDRGSSAARGYGHAWVKLRKVVLRRDNNLCVVCYSEGRITKAQAVDHIVNKADGGTDEMSNLQSICARHHEIKTRKERGGEYKEKGADVSGMPTSKDHPWYRHGA